MNTVDKKYIDLLKKHNIDLDIIHVMNPNLPFYTIPQVDIFTVDSNGGYLGSVGQMKSFFQRLRQRRSMNF